MENEEKRCLLSKALDATKLTDELTRLTPKQVSAIDRYIAIQSGIETELRTQGRWNNETEDWSNDEIYEKVRTEFRNC